MKTNEFGVLLNEFGVFAEELGAEAILGFLIGMMGIMLAAGVVFYILESLGLYTVAKRRGLGNAWLAWIPVGGNMWTLAKIGDRDTMARTNKDSRMRVWLMVLYFGAPILLFVLFSIAFFAGMFTSVTAESAIGSSSAGAFVVLMLLIYLLMLGVSIALMVLIYVAYYRYFRSCNPNNAPIFLVLGIFFSFLMPIFVFACRKKDAPLPQQSPQYEIPGQPM